MNIREFHFLNDYHDIYDWWKSWKWEPVSPKFLPPTGLMVENIGKKICCCFIFRTDSAWCIIDYFIMNPKVNKSERNGCIDFLIKEALKKAKNMGYEIASTMTSNNNLLSKLKKSGYEEFSKLTKMIIEI